MAKSIPWAKRGASRRPFVHFAGIGFVAAALVGCTGSSTTTLTPTVAATAAPGSKPESAALIGAAKQEGVVTAYLQLDPNIAAPVKAAFEKAYPPIAVTVVTLPPTAYVAELSKEGSPADVLVSNEDNLRPLLSKNVFTAYIPINIEWIPPDRRDSGGLWVQDVPAILSPAYNTNLVSKEQAPKSFKELVDPKWKGKLGLADPRKMPEIADNFGAFEREYGAAWVRQLAAQQIRMPGAGGPARDALEAGEYAVLAVGSIAGIQSRKGAGKPVDWVRTSDNSYLATFKFAALPARAPHPNAAKLFLDWFFSREGMQVQATAGNVVTYPGLKLADPDQSPEGKQLIHVTSLSDAERTALLDKYKEMFV